MKNNISVIIIDDHPIVLQGFSHILQGEDQISLLASFTSAKEGLAFLQAQEVDVVLLDINMPDMNGIDACKRISKDHPNCRVIAISNNNENSIIQRMLQSGASGYVLKNASADELVQCIKEAAAGRTALSRDVQGILQSAKAGSAQVMGEQCV